MHYKLICILNILYQCFTEKCVQMRKEIIASNQELMFVLCQLFHFSYELIFRINLTNVREANLI